MWLVRGLVDPSSTVIDRWNPEPGLLDILHLYQQPPYRDRAATCWPPALSAMYTTTRPDGKDVIITAVPKRQGSSPLNPWWDRTLQCLYLIIGYPSQLQHCKYGGINRRHFTRNGQHLTMRGKWILAEILIKSLCTPRRRPIFPKPAKSTLIPTSASAVIRPGHKTFAESLGC